MDDEQKLNYFPTNINILKYTNERNFDNDNLQTNIN